jgi:hypothetical protein
MSKFLIALMLLLIVASPAFAKPADLYPVSCNDLWASVKDTLQNPRNYGITSVDDLNRRASFVVVGNLTQYTDRVALAGNDGSCEIKSSFLEVGADNSDWRQFHHRLAQSLAKSQAAKSKPVETGAAQP